MPSFQDIIFRLKQYWANAAAHHPGAVRYGSGSGHHGSGNVLRVLGPKPHRVAYVQPSRRPADGRYGENPNRLYKHLQLQVILKPAPADVIDLYLGSLEAVGIDLKKHDIKLEEDNWEAPTLGAWGVGWQVMLDGARDHAVHLFPAMRRHRSGDGSGGDHLRSERLTAFLQTRDSLYDIEWDRGRHLRQCAHGR